MSFNTIQDDSNLLNKQITKNKIGFAPELKQGRTYLNSKTKMCKSIRRRNKKIEGFDNMGLDNSLQLPIKKKNNNEIRELVSMQNSYEKTLKQWNSKYEELLNQIENNKGLYQQCIDACNKHEDRDMLTACVYGCTSGKYISSGAAYRGPAPPPAGFLSFLEVLGSAIAVAAALAAAVALGPALLAAAAELELDASIAAAMEAAVAAASAVGSALAAAGSALAAGIVSIGSALSALTISAASFFGFAADALAIGEAFAFASSIAAEDIAAIMAVAFAVGGSVLTGYEIYEMYKKTCGCSENFEDLSLDDKRKMVVFLKTLPGAPKFEEVVGKTAQVKKAPVNKKLMYYHSQEGFTGSPQAHSISSVSGKASNIYDKKGLFQSPQMGDYGPAGYKFKDGNKIDKFKQSVNKQLSSNPQLPGNAWLTGDGAKEDAKTSQQIAAVNPSGVRAEMTKATDAFSAILKGLPNDPLIVQMQKADIGPDNLTETIQELENKWKGIFESVCEAGIAKDTQGGFAGHQQYCKSWTNMGGVEKRSGFYGQLWTADSMGNKQDNKLKGKTFNLNNNAEIGSQDDKNNSRMGCDIMIPGTRSSDSNVGGAGYCECTDGSTIYMDSGHPNITCNDLCYPKNIKNPGKKNLFYHDSSVWTPSLEAVNGKTGPGAFGISPQPNAPGANSKPWLNCGSNGSEPDGCPSGMKQIGDVSEMSVCGTYKDKGRLPFWEQVADDVDIFGTPYPVPTIANKGRRCVYALPDGGDKPYVGPKQVEDNGMGAQIPVGYVKLGSPKQLVNSCSNSKYPNIYIEILALRALEIILGNKTEVMSKILKNSNDARIKTKLQQTEAGRRLLKNLNKYQKTYNKFQDNEAKANLLDGMVEDISFKKDSANLNYYLWFALAISGMLLVIKNVKN